MQRSSERGQVWLLLGGPLERGNVQGVQLGLKGRQRGCSLPVLLEVGGDTGVQVERQQCSSYCWMGYNRGPHSLVDVGLLGS